MLSTRRCLASDRITKRLGIKGLLVVNVQTGSSAEKAGIRGTKEVRGKIILGDIIIAVNGVPVESYDDLRNELDRYHVGDEVTLIIQRGEENKELTVRLEEAE
jgi:S1-C subfamily serine protease